MFDPLFDSRVGWGQIIERFVQGPAIGRSTREGRFFFLVVHLSISSLFVVMFSTDSPLLSDVQDSCTA